MKIEAFFDERTWTLTYVVWADASKDAVVIDPVLDYEIIGSKYWTESSDRVIEFIQRHQLNLHYILETHAHADHLSGSQVLKSKFPEAKVAISSHITTIQSIFKPIFELPVHFPVDGSQFDKLIEDNETFEAGELKIHALSTPGHTPACSSYLIEDALFTGDTLFMPDMGTGRCDFPSGSAQALHASITHQLYTLPNTTRVFVGHDYRPGGRELAYETTIGEQKAKNIQLSALTTLEDFVEFRTARDAQLAAPKLLYPSVQINIDAGHLPSPERTGSRLLKMPLQRK